MSDHIKLLQKVVVVGNSGAGKTALMKQYVNKEFANTEKGTVGAEISIKKIVINKSVITMQIWDTAGTERFQSVCTAYYRGADCCVLVFDVTNRESFRNLNSWRKEVLINANSKDPEHFPFVVLGNKVDLPNRQVSMEEARKWCKMHDIKYYETSAKDGRNLADAFESMAEKVFEPTVVVKDTVKVDSEPPKAPENNSCCNNNSIHTEKCY